MIIFVVLIFLTLLATYYQINNLMVVVVISLYVCLWIFKFLT